MRTGRIEAHESGVDLGSKIREKLEGLEGDSATLPEVGYRKLDADLEPPSGLSPKIGLNPRCSTNISLATCTPSTPALVSIRRRGM